MGIQLGDGCVRGVCTHRPLAIVLGSTVDYDHHKCVIIREGYGSKALVYPTRLQKQKRVHTPPPSSKFISAYMKMNKHFLTP